MEKTSVEWLSNEFYEKLEVKGDGALFNDLVNQAKEMEKQQIIDAIVWFDDTDRTPSQIEISAEQYYNQTFKQD
jgi:hypothetical protein